MKKITLLLLLLVSYSGFAQFPLPYCGPITFATNVEPITLVNFAGINNSTSPAVNGTPAHENFISTVGNVTTGTAYTITLKGNTDGGFTNRFMVFADWNQDGDFADANEAYTITQTINSSTGADAIQATQSLQVPPNALGGTTRMRVKKIYGTTNYADPCLGTDYGQVEDYSLNVTAVAACLTGDNYPTGVLNITNCDGFTATEIATDSYAGDYFYVAVTSGQTYKFSSSIATDYFTLSTDDGVTAVSSGVSPLTWVSNFTGNARVHINTNSSCGTEATERSTSVICGVACLTGTLYPTATYNVSVCDGTTVNVVATDSYAGEYSNVNVFDSNDYVFSSSNATDYITVASADGLTPLALGTGSVSYAPTADGIVRVYFHTNATCGTQATNRERRIVCTTALTVPQCASNPTPADGSTTVTAFGTFDVSWDAPTSGDPATSYDLYDGTNIANLVFDGNFTTTTIPGVSIGAYSTTTYWKIVPRNAAGAALGCAIWSFTTEPQPTDTPDYVNLQFPPTATITQGGSVTVYGQVYEGGLTDVAPNIVGQAPGILAWVGTGATGTNPNTWTNWTVATWNSGQVGNNDEYQANIGATLAPGTYDYATRFSLNDGPYVYGGYTPPGGGFWDGTTNISGVLTVTPPPAPNNDECGGAIALTAGGLYADYITNGTNLGATTSSQTAPVECFGFSGGDVWFTVVVPASGSITIETGDSTTGGTGVDTVITMYTGADCSSLTEVGCSDDEGVGAYSLKALTGLTAGSTLYIRAYEYGNNNAGNFGISAYDGSLGNSSFDSTNFTYYPNPVKNILNLSYNQEISNVVVYNLLGQKISSNVINANDAQIDMSNLSKGAYMVKVTSNDQVKTIKVIKE